MIRFNLALNLDSSDPSSRTRRKGWSRNNSSSSSRRKEERTRSRGQEGVGRESEKTKKDGYSLLRLVGIPLLLLLLRFWFPLIFRGGVARFRRGSLNAGDLDKRSRAVRLRDSFGCSTCTLINRWALTIPECGVLSSLSSLVVVLLFASGITLDCIADGLPPVGLLYCICCCSCCCCCCCC